MVEKFAPMNFDKVAGTEARGFLFGAPLAIELGIGFVPVRKPGKLPRQVISESYELEYGMDTLEIHEDAIKPGERVVAISGSPLAMRGATSTLRLYKIDTNGEILDAQ